MVSAPSSQRRRRRAARAARASRVWRTSTRRRGGRRRNARRVAGAHRVGEAAVVVAGRPPAARRPPARRRLGDAGQRRPLDADEPRGVVGERRESATTAATGVPWQRTTSPRHRSSRHTMPSMARTMPMGGNASTSAATTTATHAGAFRAAATSSVAHARVGVRLARNDVGPPSILRSSKTGPARSSGGSCGDGMARPTWVMGPRIVTITPMPRGVGGIAWPRPPGRPGGRRRPGLHRRVVAPDFTIARCSSPPPRPPTPARPWASASRGTSSAAPASADAEDARPLLAGEIAAPPRPPRRSRPREPPRIPRLLDDQPGRASRWRRAQPEPARAADAADRPARERVVRLVRAP